MSERPSLTIAQTVEQFKISRATVRRAIDSGKFPHAVKDGAGRWRIPLEDLIGAKIPGRKSWLTEAAHEGINLAHDEHPESAHIPDDHIKGVVASELAHYENELARERAKVAQLETQLEAEKRLREASERNADDLRTALRMIEAGPNLTPSNEEQPTPRRRWWQQRR